MARDAVRRRTAGLWLAVLLAVGMAVAATRTAEAQGGATVQDLSKETLVYVGSDTRGEGQGIYLFRLQTKELEVSQNITLVPMGLAAEAARPSSIEIDSRRRLLFAVNEVDEFEGKRTGSVGAFSIDAATGKLTPLNRRATLGTRPCHLALDADARHLLVANCGSGGAAVLPIAPDGRLGEASAVPAPRGAGVAGEHGAPGAQCVVLDPASRFAFVCDAAADAIQSYRYDATTGKLDPLTSTPLAGSGPWRMLFRPDGRFAYVVGAQSSTVDVLSYDAASGRLSAVQSVSSVPEYYDGPNTARELGMHPTGKYLYVSNDGHNSVVLFGIDPDKGTLSYVEEQGTGGKQPRHFGIEPSAKHLAIVNQGSDSVLASRIDAGNGRLKPSGVFATVPSPACVRFLPPLEGTP